MFQVSGEGKKGEISYDRKKKTEDKRRRNKELEIKGDNRGMKGNNNNNNE